MANRKKPTARQRRVQKPESSSSELFTFSLPVHFTMQFTFPASQILNPHVEDPEISEHGIKELENELAAYLRQNYAVDDVNVLADTLDSVFLGKSSE